ncbi:helix-turn-helix transcriptional regulator [Streptomyces sp. NPDC050617]|uniref:response regulator transcription factor n=1 Tax=Streptomyces sp. NPDC050617 TaxID=3154628 RepID=UPI00341E966C
MTSSRPTPPGTSLTPHEKKVLELVAEGLENRQIAQETKVGPSTVKGHLRAIRTKLGVRSRAAMVARGYRTGQLPLPKEEELPSAMTELDLRLLRLLCEGRSIMNIADLQTISQRTAQSNITQLLFKVGAPNMAKAVTLGYQWRVLATRRQDRCRSEEAI